MELLTNWLINFAGRKIALDRAKPEPGMCLRPSPKRALNPRVLHMALFLLWVVALGAPSLCGQGTRAFMSVGTPTVDANGVQYYPVTSVYQGSQQQIIRVLEPTDPVPGQPRRILYVLPVDAGVDTLSSTYGDGLDRKSVV